MISRSSSLMSSANVGRGALSRKTKVVMSQQCQIPATAGRHDRSSRTPLTWLPAAALGIHEAGRFPRTVRDRPWPRAQRAPIRADLSGSLLRVRAMGRGRASSATAHLGLSVNSGSGDEAELAEHGDAVVEADLLGNEAALNLQNGGAGESHHLAGAGWQRADGHVVERLAGVGAAAFPLADHIVALGDEIGGAPEVQVRERGAELPGERADRVSATQRRVQRVLEPDVRGRELVDDGRVEVLTPELREPPAHNSLVLLDRHRSFPSWP